MTEEDEWDGFQSKENLNMPIRDGISFMNSRNFIPKLDKKALASRAGRGEWSTARLVSVHSEFATRKVIALAGK